MAEEMEREKQRIEKEFREKLEAQKQAKEKALRDTFAQAQEQRKL